MRGDYLPSAYGSALTSDDPLEEIQRAIDEVRFAGRQQRNSDEPERRAAVPGKKWSSGQSQAPQLVVVGPTDRAETCVIVSVRGRAPRDFFRWFAELRSRLEDQHMMLQLCHFEEDE